MGKPLDLGALAESLGVELEPSAEPPVPLEPARTRVRVAEKRAERVARAAARVAAAKTELERRRILKRQRACRQSFEEFVREFWAIAEPAHTYVDNEASSALILHLQALADGAFKQLAISLPPGFGKSTIVSVLYPAWRWARNPAWRVLTASHEFGLATRDSRRTRRILESAEYRAMFPDVRLRHDANRQDEYETTEAGHRIAIGVGGGLTGKRGDAFIIDDSLNAIERFSKTARERVNNWFADAASSRLDGDEPEFVIIQQRLHATDLIGHLRKSDPDGWVWLNLAAVYDTKYPCVTPVWEDARTAGELLAPALLSEAKIGKLRTKMGSVGFNCQYQQQPSDESGGMFKREWWRWWKPDGTAGGGRVEGARIDPACALPTTFDRVVIAIDTNQKKAETSDFTAMVVIGVVKARRYVLELVHGQLDYVGLRLWVVKLATKYRGATVLVEEASNGYAILAELGGRVPNLIAVKPLGGKEARAAAMSPGVEAGDWYLPEGAGWVETFVAEHAGFPGAEHDDIVDAAAHAANYLIESGDYETMLAAFGGGRR